MERHARVDRRLGARCVLEVDVDVVAAGLEHVVDRGPHLRQVGAQELVRDVLEEGQRPHPAKRAYDGGAAVGSITEDRHALGEHGEAPLEQEHLAEVGGIDEPPVLNPREAHRPTAPRVVEVGAIDALDDQRDVLVREHEVIGLPHRELRPRDGQLGRRETPGARGSGRKRQRIGGPVVSRRERRRRVTLRWRGVLRARVCLVRVELARRIQRGIGAWAAGERDEHERGEAAAGLHPR
jgi:hypothetical protein